MRDPGKQPAFFMSARTSTHPSSSLGRDSSVVMASMVRASSIRGVVTGSPSIFTRTWSLDRDSNTYFPLGRHSLRWATTGPGPQGSSQVCSSVGQSSTDVGVAPGRANFSNKLTCHALLGMAGGARARGHRREARRQARGRRGGRGRHRRGGAAGHDESQGEGPEGGRRPWLGQRVILRGWRGGSEARRPLVRRGERPRCRRPRRRSGPRWPAATGPAI